MSIVRPFSRCYAREHTKIRATLRRARLVFYSFWNSSATKASYQTLPSKEYTYVSSWRRYVRIFSKELAVDSYFQTYDFIEFLLYLLSIHRIVSSSYSLSNVPPYHDFVPFRALFFRVLDKHSFMPFVLFTLPGSRAPGVPETWARISRVSWRATKFSTRSKHRRIRSHETFTSTMIVRKTAFTTNLSSKSFVEQSIRNKHIYRVTLRIIDVTMSEELCQILLQSSSRFRYYYNITCTCLVILRFTLSIETSRNFETNDIWTYVYSDFLARLDECYVLLNFDHNFPGHLVCSLSLRPSTNGRVRCVCSGLFGREL